MCWIKNAPACSGPLAAAAGKRRLKQQFDSDESLEFLGRSPFGLPLMDAFEQ